MNAESSDCCASCGVPWMEHDGITLTCEAKQDAESETLHILNALAPSLMSSISIMTDVQRYAGIHSGDSRWKGAMADAVLRIVLGAAAGAFSFDGHQFSRAVVKPVSCGAIPVVEGSNPSRPLDPWENYAWREMCTVRGTMTTRLFNCLCGAGVDSREKAESAYLQWEAGPIYHWPRNYGPLCHSELADWLGLVQPRNRKETFLRSRR